MFLPRNKWNPHSKALFFSWYGLLGDNIILIVNNISASVGVNKEIKGKVKK